MGACYSKSGHDVDNAKKKSPHNKKHKNGIAVTIEYSPVRSPNHDEDRLSIYDNESEKEDKIVIESNGNVEGQCCSKVAKDKEKVVPGNEGENSVKCDLVTSKERSDEVITSDLKVTEKVVSASDSGIESLPAQESRHSSQTFCDKTKPYQNSDEDETLASPKNEIHDSHGEFTAPSRSRPYRFSDIIYLKSSLKKPGRPSGRYSRLSCKSTDSLDWTATLINSLDRCRSEASEFFCEDFNISAPLAAFDSVDFMSSAGSLLRNRLSRASIVDYNNDTFQFQFDFSGIEAEEAEASSVPITSESLPCSPVRQNTVSPDGVNLELAGSKRASQELRRFDSEASLELTSTFPRLEEVKTMQIDGKDVVVIDVETYVHIMEELAMLKMKLSQLTDFLQEQDLLQLDSSKERADISSLNQSIEDLMDTASLKKP
ncbi:uncharacterized protein LOC133206271 isoform X2 [Saccostrea echinata]|uniref:uncharacterized protein LOC133206271 isoform X2 n=1 Tax=Saccostrea echinata TaxID=191078 RepID=UPI002A81CF26|nr:uncharacterized protein LOC133206271 isoform X2 [Saccostrea echinata]